MTAQLLFHSPPEARFAGSSAMMALEHTVPAGGQIDRLYTDLSPFVTALIRRLTDDPEMRKDLQGEAYLVYRSLVERYDPQRGIPLKPYLICQLKSHLFSQCRSRRGVSRRETCLAAVESTSLCADPMAEWNRGIELRRLADALPAMLSHVPVRQRRVILWRYYDGATFEEIGEKLQVQPATARSLLRHGLNRLRVLASERGYSRMDE